MRKLLIKFLIFIAGFWLVSISLAGIADHFAPMNVYSSIEAKRIKSLLERRKIISAISIGNSHSGAISFDTFGKEGQVLARAGTDLYEVKQYVYSIIPKLPTLNTVFIAISYFSFNRDNVLVDDTRNLRIELYSMLPTWTPLPGDEEYLVMGKIHKYFHLMSVVRPDHWHEVLIKVNNPDVASSIEGSVQSVTPWGTCSHFTQSELASIGYEIGFKAANNHLNSYKANPKIREQTYQALSDTIEMLQERGVRIVLFTPPYYMAYNERFREIAPEMIESMFSAVDHLRNQHNVEYYNASTLPDFTNKPELFINSDHLNECGSRAFTEYLMKQMDLR